MYLYLMWSLCMLIITCIWRQIIKYTSNSNIYTVMANLHRCYEHEKFHFLAAFGWNLCKHYMASTTDENIYVLFMYFTYLYMLNYT